MVRFWLWMQQHALAYTIPLIMGLVIVGVALLISWLVR
jgi:hypothetical protein